MDASSLGALFARHQKVALSLSGGKDSTALAWLCRPYRDRINVLFGDTGASFPHVREHVERLCERAGYRLTIVHAWEDIRAYHAREGLPSDILPVEATTAMAPFLPEPPKVLLQSYLRCCATMLWAPMDQAVKASGATLVLRGVKSCDPRKGVPPGTVVEGIEYAAPIYDWTDADVLAYLEAEGVTLPAHYPEVGDSLDCTICSGHLAHHGTAKLRWMKQNTPDLWPEIRDNVRKVRRAVLGHVVGIGEAASAAMED